MLLNGFLTLVISRPPPPYQQDKQNKWIRWIRRVLELRPILNDLWALIRTPLKEALTKPVCKQWIKEAKSFEASGFHPDFYPFCDSPCERNVQAFRQQFPHLDAGSCSTRRNLDTATDEQHRQLPVSAFNFTAAALTIYRHHMKPIEDVMDVLARFHDFDEMLLMAWEGGIEAGLEVLYEAIGIVRQD